MTDRYVCVHGHFYQPPRENAFLEAVEVQDSAAPYHDWNERITAECYAPNAAARILDGEGKIIDIVNNYARISFDFGPTLLAWLERKAPETYRAILEADRRSRARFSGHGSAMAHGYNHAILPLANERDRRTQIRWGIADFERRFGRRPEGFWLPETASCAGTLEALAAEGIAFTVLSPSQAHRVRALAGGHWEDVSGGRIDPSRAYRAHLPSGRPLAVFFYDGPVSRAVAFERVLSNGEAFAGRILSAFSGERRGAQLAHLATDGESYGHHHRHGEMALAYALEHVARNGLARLTNYGEFLERHPPAHEVVIYERSSWSCAHGVERWRSDCGCNGGRAGWNQAWRAPLREGLEALRDAMDALFAERGGELFRDPWAARDAYVSVILDRSPGNVTAFLEAHARRPLGNGDRPVALKLLELQRNVQLTFTSCAWFFDDVSGIETVQVLQYAARAIQLARELRVDAGPDAVEAALEETLARARGNVREHRDGRQVWRTLVKPALADLPRVAAHFAVSSLFEPAEARTRVEAFSVETLDRRVLEAGRARLAVGRAAVTSTITLESAVFSFAVVHMGDHVLVGGVRPFRGVEAYDALAIQVQEAFQRADLHEVLRLLDAHFEAATYSLRSLFRDQQRRVLDLVLRNVRAEAETVQERLHRTHAPFLRFLSSLGIPTPPEFRAAASLALNGQLRKLLEAEDLDAVRIEAAVSEARASGISLDEGALAAAARRALERLASGLAARPGDLTALLRLEKAVAAVAALPFEVDLWRAQELYWRALEEVLPAQRKRAEQDEAGARAWVQRFGELGERLGVRAR